MTQDSDSSHKKVRTQSQDEKLQQPQLTRRRFGKLASVLLASLTLPTASVALASKALVKGVRLWRSPDKTRLVFDMSMGVDHKVFPLIGPTRVVLDIFGARISGSLSSLDFKGTPIKRVRESMHDDGKLRIVLDLKEDVTPRSFALKPNSTYGHRLVIDLFDRDAMAAAKKKPKPKSRDRDIIVAIDAGHGGEDPGAIGHRGAREKDVVLAISQEVASQFRKTPGFKPLLIRTGDYYIALGQRTQRAREERADVFISIHADAFNRAAANGSSVYTLSERGATSETARWLADKENSSDLIGGEDGVSLGDKDDILASVLLDLSMTASLSRSEKIGTQVLDHLGKVNRLHKSKVEQAAFAVLKNPAIPSLLVETGFITNPKEASKLINKAHQKKLARAIYKGVQEFFENNPPVGTLLASQRRAASAITYKVKSGDTLGEIANKHNVKLEKLLSFNSLDRKDMIQVGQTIRIP